MTLFKKFFKKGLESSKMDYDTKVLILFNAVELTDTIAHVYNVCKKSGGNDYKLKQTAMALMERKDENDFPLWVMNICRIFSFLFPTETKAKFDENINMPDLVAYINQFAQIEMDKIKNKEIEKFKQRINEKSEISN